MLGLQLVAQGACLHARELGSRFRRLPPARGCKYPPCDFRPTLHVPSERIHLNPKIALRIIQTPHTVPRIMASETTQRTGCNV